MGYYWFTKRRNEMFRLKNKVVYIVATGCRKSVELPQLIRRLEDEGAIVYLFATNECMKIVNFEDDAFKDVNLRFNNNIDKRMEILEEDLVIVAPCSFNTINKIANGISDSYPLTIIQTSIGKGVPVIIAASMNYGLWNNFNTQQSISTLSKVNNINVIWPEFIYNEAGSVSKTTMSPWEKLEDTIFSYFQLLPFNLLCESKTNAYNKLDNENNGELKLFGKICKELYLCPNRAGCIAKKVEDGVLISSTGSCVGSLENEDMVVIKKYDENTSSITYCGCKPPSSESKIIYQILKEKPVGTCILHCHCQRITYSPKSKYFTTSRYFINDDDDRVQEVEKIINQYGLVNLYLHGQICCGNSFENIIGVILKKYYEFC